MNLLGMALKAFWRQTAKKGPILAAYYLTERCNSKCRYCDIWRKGGGMASIEDVLENLEGLSAMGVDFVSFTGGEPLLYPFLPEVLQKAKSLGMRTTLITNGILYPQRAKEIRGLVDDLEFSLSTLDAERYAWERGIDALSMVLKGIEKAVSLGESLSILATILRENLEDLPGLIEYARTRGVLCILGPVYRYFGNDPFPKEEAHRLRSFASQTGAWMNRAFLEFLASGGNRTDRPRCRAMRGTLAISPDNHLLVPCYHHCLQRIPIRGNLPKIVRETPFQGMAKRVGRWEFCRGCHIFCYFEGSFLWPPGRYFLLDAQSRIRWWAQNRRVRSSSFNVGR